MLPDTAAADQCWTLRARVMARACLFLNPGSRKGRVGSIPTPPQLIFLHGSDLAERLRSGPAHRARRRTDRVVPITVRHRPVVADHRSNQGESDRSGLVRSGERHTLTYHVAPQPDAGPWP